MAARLAAGLIGVAVTGNTVVLAANNYILEAVYINPYLMNSTVINSEARLRLRSGTTELIVKGINAPTATGGRWVEADVQFVWSNGLVLTRGNTINFDYFLDPQVTAFAWNYALFGTIVS